jgi:hypothetical protein
VDDPMSLQSKDVGGMDRFTVGSQLSVEPLSISPALSV